MSDLSITAANVKPSTTSGVTTTRPSAVVLAEDVTAGQVLYVNTSGTYGLAKANGTDTQATAVGIAAANGYTGQSIPMYGNGTRFRLGATLTKGIPYFASPNNPGGVCALGDVGSTNYLTFLGYGASTTDLVLAINATGVVQ